jgi:hypothetical protein
MNSLPAWGTCGYFRGLSMRYAALPLSESACGRHPILYTGAMTARRCLLVFGLLPGVLALGAGVLLLWPRTAITRENAAKIKEGMTLAQVEALLGGPPRSETTGATLTVDEQPMGALQHFAFQLNMNRKPMPPKWQSDHVVIAVRFDPDG